MLITDTSSSSMNSSLSSEYLISTQNSKLERIVILSKLFAPQEGNYDNNLQSNAIMKDSEGRVCEDLCNALDLHE
ncbi:plant intracellular ras group-related LRR 3 [Prunus dulcis]|uniref:Plant intracellular ras group-related LRR 3 n=1 Tax=Prunus dulcis TaxID=3755 RepID=A0A4Y1RCT4_PRUDU|nr:plant intracellular ras group-related LRR 3 [Prunus dulcis]